MRIIIKGEPEEVNDPALLLRGQLEKQEKLKNTSSSKQPEYYEMDEKRREEAMMILSQVLKDVANGEYIPIPKSLPVEDVDKAYFKEKAIFSIRTAMKELDMKLNLEEGLRNSLMFTY